jgi:hypothetical protein
MDIVSGTEFGWICGRCFLHDDSRDGQRKNEKKHKDEHDYSYDD